jgi:hypothetical protein
MSGRRRRAQLLASRSAPPTTTRPVVRVTAPAALVGVGALFVSGVGIADAATGGNFILGKKNTAGAVTTLSNPNGTPLSLKAKSGSAPLAVNTSKLVAKLNANFLNGLSASQLQRRLSGTCTSTGIASVGSGGAATCAQGEQIVFTTSGTFTVPAGVTHITGELWGAGGAAGYQLGGGGSGAFESVMLTVSPGDVIHVTVGQGGTFASYPNGNPGGATTLSIGPGPVIAGAGGGDGGLYPCGPVNGGTATAPTSPALGLSSRSGEGGDCSNPGGDAGFAGAGGYPFGASGSNGLVILSVDH